MALVVGRAFRQAGAAGEQRRTAARTRVPQPRCASRLSRATPCAVATSAITRTTASLSSQCDPGTAKAAACPRKSATGTARAARTARTALAARDLDADLSHDVIPAAATSERRPREKVSASILGSGSRPPRAISTTPGASHRTPPTIAARAATFPRPITHTTVSRDRCDVELCASYGRLSARRHGLTGRHRGWSCVCTSPTHRGDGAVQTRRIGRGVCPCRFRGID